MTIALAINPRGSRMKKEAMLLNLLCLLVALGLFGFVLWNAITVPDFISTDNLFITVVFLLLALMFAVGPLLFLKSEGKLPIPFQKRSTQSSEPAQLWGATATQQRPALLDAKGRAVPPDVRNMVGRFTPAKRKDA